MDARAGNVVPVEVVGAGGCGGYEGYSGAFEELGVDFGGRTDEEVGAAGVDEVFIGEFAPGKGVGGHPAAGECVP